jgi:hypothetical protein
MGYPMKLSAALQPHLKPIYEIISGSFGDYDKFYSPEAKITHDSSCRAHIRNSHMRDRAVKYAAKTSNVKPFESMGLQGIVIDQYVAIVFKKLDDDRRPRNNLTNQMKGYLRQESLEGIEAPVKLIAGYTESETGDMAAAYVTRPSGIRQNKWELLVTDEEAKTVVTPLFEDDIEIEEAEIKGRKESAEIFRLRIGDEEQS